MNEVSNALEVQALKFLATRDYGVRELAQKLGQKVPQATAKEIEACIDMFKARGWLDETRFIERAVARALEKGDGPLKIRQKLKDAIEDSALLETALALPEEAWVASARGALEKKFGDALRPKETKALAKRLRFLQGRGFTQSHSWTAMQE